MQSMPILTYCLLALVAYLLGSIPFGYLLVRLVRKEDIRAVGSGNIGATNVIRSGAKGLGLLTFVLDAFKGYIAVVFALWMLSLSSLAVLAHVPAQNAAAVAAFAAILGHIFPVWLGFKGGKGVATAFGVLAALVPFAALAALGIFILIFAVTRYVSLGSVVAAACYPFLGLLLTHGERTPLFAIVLFLMSALVIFKHRANLVRLWRGTEYRFDKKTADHAESEHA